MNGLHGPPTPVMGRGMLLFAALVGGLGIFLLAGRDWRNGGLWLSVAIFLGCYGLLMGDHLMRWNKALLVVGGMAGVVAFGFAVMQAF